MEAGEAERREQPHVEQARQQGFEEEGPPDGEEAQQHEGGGYPVGEPGDVGARHRGQDEREARDPAVDDPVGHGYKGLGRRE